ncbi:MAG: S9 family peptidase [Parachlamydiaceae bacterium]|nr:S9 family peptidase [Parachlamydiaceae bacterium]
MFRRSLIILPFLAALSVAAIHFNALDDPYRWLEDRETPQTIDWLAEQHIKCEEYFADTVGRSEITKRLTEIMQMDSVYSPKIHQDYTFVMARLKGQQHSSIYIVDEKKCFQLVVDPLTLSADGTLSISNYIIHDKSSLIAYGVQKSGSDFEEWHIKDFKTGQEFSDHLSRIKFCPPIWDVKGEGLYYFRFDDNDIQSLYYHRIGDLTEDDTKLYTSSLTGTICVGLLICDGHYLKFNERKGCSITNSVVYADLDCELCLKPLSFTELFPQDDASYSYAGCRDGRLYFFTDKGAPKGKIISIDPAKNDILEVLGEKQGIIQQAFCVGNNLIVNYLTNGYSNLQVIEDNGRQHSVSLPGIGTVTLAHALQVADAKEFFFSYHDFVRPTTLYVYNIETKSVSHFLKPEFNWNPEDFEIHQLSYPSNDGVQVPLFVVHKKGLQLDSLNPTLLYAYGGFGLSVTPYFSSSNLVWFETGGVYAVASIRGGGELGEEWHRAGILKNKQQSFDDFKAAATYLCNNGYTQKAKLAIHGGSNGGLLVGACLTQNPELFTAAIADVGVFDMLRFHLFTVGWAWMTEYGSPDDPEDFEVLRKYSPYHCVEKGKAYPATLIRTGDHDDRVVPLHSFKFAAALQEAQGSENPIVLRVNYNTGHGAGKSQNQMILEATERLLFLNKELR